MSRLSICSLDVTSSVLFTMKLVLKAALFSIFAAPLLASTPHVRPLRPNIVLVTIDTLRADHVGCYGGVGVSTPTLDALGRDGIIFERAIAQVPLTYPSHAAIMTGLYPFQNGAQDFTSPPLDPRFRTVAQALREHGYSTGAVVSSFALDQSWGLARGFDFYDDAFSPESYKNRELGLVERKAEESVTHALGWLKRNHKRPFFLWLHLYDPHSPYSPPEPFATQFKDRPYDGEVAYVDQQLGRFVAWLRTSRLYDQALIVVVGDHGESLGEHGEKEHGFFLYNSTIHVPLIVKPPARSGYKPGRNESIVETVGIPATILQFASVTDPAGEHSPPLLGKAASPSAAYSETFYPFDSFGWSPLHSLQDGRFHFIDAPSAELYDVVADPGERNNLVSQQSATVAVLREKLQRILQTNHFQRDANKESGLSPEAQRKLQALGYVAYQSPVPEQALLGGLPDPKTKLAVFNELLEAQDALHAGDFERGRTLLNEIRKQDDRLYIVSFYLGEAALAQRDWASAAAEFKDCLDRSPGFQQAMTGLARALMMQGDTKGATVWAQRVLEVNPQNYQAWYELGFIETGRDHKLAIRFYEKAAALQPSFAPIQRDLGILQLQEGNFAEAAKRLEKVVELGAEDASVLNALGLAYGRTQRLEKAVLAYKKALALNDHVPEIHLNLASAYERLKRPEDAAAEYQSACKLEPRYCR